MIQNRYVILFLLIGFTAWCSCNSGKTSEGKSSCKTEGEVQDFTGLDGCQLLIVTKDGKKLLPGKILDSDIQLEAGLKIRFDYRPIDMMSVCMTEDLIVEITCLEVSND